MRGADALVAALKARGVDTIFALSGNQIMPVFDACLEAGIRLVHTRHEAAAGFMAEGFAQASDRIGVALVTAGGGLANAIAPLMTASASQTPLLLLSGDSPVGQDGTGAFQEMDQLALTRSLTKLSRRVTDAADVVDAVAEAIDAACSGDPGPVHLSLPMDVLNAECPRVETPTTSSAPAVDIGPIVDALRAATRPLVLLGPALRGNAGALRRALGCPVWVLESPRGGNDPSLGRFGVAWSQADLVVALGKPIDFSVGFGSRAAYPEAEWITVHGDPVEQKRAVKNLGARLRIGLLASAGQVADGLAGIGDWPSWEEWHREVAELCKARPLLPRDSALSSASLCEAVGSFASLETVLVFDGGEFGQWAQTIAGSGCRIVNGVSGVIGAGLCYAIGARAARPDAVVIALMGDGTVGFHLPEFETAVREGLPFVAIVGNDMRWNAEHQIQMRDYGEERTHSCTLSPARYDLAVEALGGFGAHVSEVGQVSPALAAAVESGLPACVNVEIDGLPAPRFQ